MNTDVKITIIEKIWENPTPVFGDCKPNTSKRWLLNNYNCALIRKTRSEGLTVTGNHDAIIGGGNSMDVFTFIQDYVFHTVGFWETLKECAKCYNVELKLTDEQRKAIGQRALLREVVPYLCTWLSEHQDGRTAQYLKGRGFTIDGEHFGELTAESIKRAKELLKASGYTYDEKDFKALGLTEERAAEGYNVVIPYRHNGQIYSVMYRSVNPDADPKYRYVAGMEVVGYCDSLQPSKQAVIVEGILDAIALTQAGSFNVFAMGAAKPNEKETDFLNAHGIRTVVYIPDVEQDKKDPTKRRTDLIDGAIKAFQEHIPDVDLYISELPQEGTKTDVADFYKQHGGKELLQTIDKNIVEWWNYELSRFEDEIAEREQKGETINLWEVKERFKDIYSRCNPFDRKRIKKNIKGVPMYEERGITPETLDDVDEWNRQTDYTNRIKAAASDLTKAVEDGANPVKVAEIVRRLSNAQTTNTQDEWDKQFSASFEDLLEQVKHQPETLKTKWELGTLNKNSRVGGKEYIYIAREHIEFAPAAITVFCAPTSHGKTTILLQSAIDLIKDYPDKMFIYVSCEENQWQLFERSLNVCIGIDTTPTGKDNLQNVCFVSGARRKTIEAALRGDAQPPKGFVSGQWKDLYNPTEWAEICRRINTEVSKFKANTFPHLKVVNTGGSVEGIVSNVRHSIEVCEAQGYEVGGVFVDYMQLLTSDGSNAARNYELKAVCNALKDCATETNIPFIIAAQLNREAIARRNDGGGLDGVTVSNIGEGADIERIANAIYLVWQVDKTKRDDYIDTKDNKESSKRMGERSLRIFKRATNDNGGKDLKNGYLYVESLKARNGNTGSWGLLKFDGEANRVGLNDSNKMEE